MVETRLLQLAVMKISIHVDPAERPFDRINLAILVAIQLLKMIVGQVRELRIGHARSMGIGMWIVALRIFQHAVIHEIRPGSHDGFGDDLPMGIDWTMTLSSDRARFH